MIKINIIIIGFKGCGKTFIGNIIADKLKRKFHDIDSIIESIYSEQTQNRLSFREIYIKHGDKYFRDLEKIGLELICKFENSVIALGGGTVFADENIKEKLAGNIMLYLYVEPNMLYERIMKTGIPAFFDDLDSRGSFDRLYGERQPTYKKLADVVVDNSNGIETTVSNILKELNKKGVR